MAKKKKTAPVVEEPKVEEVAPVVKTPKDRAIERYEKMFGKMKTDHKDRKDRRSSEKKEA